MESEELSHRRILPLTTKTGRIFQIMCNEEKCRLCLRQRKLCKSHIIPEFFYKQMQLYDSKHRYSVLSTRVERHPISAPRGIYEKLLCEKCEKKFSRWEDYVRRALYGGESVEITTSDTKGIECIVDYAKFKLFQMSIIWRMGISTHNAFSSIILDEHENILRCALDSETPGDSGAYGCVVIHSSKHTDITSNMIHCMGMSDIDGILSAQILMGGLMWWFFLSNTATDSTPTELFLQESGRWRILMTDKNPGLDIELLAIELHHANPSHFDEFGK